MNDRDIYLKLTAMAEELTKLAAEAESLVGEMALQHAAATIGGTAKAIYDHALGGESH
jgi:predicted ATPase with chaperone activity